MVFYSLDKFHSSDMANIHIRICNIGVFVSIWISASASAIINAYFDLSASEGKIAKQNWACHTHVVID